jgi:hypothetical protein
VTLLTLEAARALLGDSFRISKAEPLYECRVNFFEPCVLALPAGALAMVRQDMLASDRSNMPGLLRASFGLYNSKDDVDALVEALFRITTGDFRGQYVQNTASGEFIPHNWQPKFEQYFSLD